MEFLATKISKTKKGYRWIIPTYRFKGTLWVDVFKRFIAGYRDILWPISTWRVYVVCCLLPQKLGKKCWFLPTRIPGPGLQGVNGLKLPTRSVSPTSCLLLLIEEWTKIIEHINRLLWVSVVAVVCLPRRHGLFSHLQLGQNGPQKDSSWLA